MLHTSTHSTPFCTLKSVITFLFHGKHTFIWPQAEAISYTLLSIKLASLSFSIFMDCKLISHLLTSHLHRDVTYQTETKGTGLFKRHNNWEFVALSREWHLGVPLFMYPHRGEKRRGSKGKGI